MIESGKIEDLWDDDEDFSYYDEILSIIMCKHSSRVEEC